MGARFFLWNCGFFARIWIINEVLLQAVTDLYRISWGFRRQIQPQLCRLERDSWRRRTPSWTPSPRALTEHVSDLLQLIFWAYPMAKGFIMVVFLILVRIFCLKYGQNNFLEDNHYKLCTVQTEWRAYPMAKGFIMVVFLILVRIFCLKYGQNNFLEDNHYKLCTVQSEWRALPPPYFSWFLGVSHGKECCNGCLWEFF